MKYKVHNILSITLFSTIFLSLSASSEIYQCKENGILIFQQLPCENETKVECEQNVDYSKISNSVKSSYEKYCFKEQIKREDNAAKRLLAEKRERIANEKRVESQRLADELANQEKLRIEAEQRDRDIFERNLDNSDLFEIESAISSDEFYVEYFAKGYNMEATYTNDNGSIEQSKIANYWYKKMLMPIDSVASLSVQNKDTDGDVEIFIKVNGKLFKHAKSDAKYGVASSRLQMSNEYRDASLADSAK
ncbi:MAG: hypothetical protein WBM99_04295 [Psychromonas sp.]